MFVSPSMAVQCRTEEQQQKKKMKAKRGSLAVLVGLEGEEGGLQRFTIPIGDLCHPLYKELLEKSEEVFGSNTTGVIRLPCSVEEFERIKSTVEQQSYDAQYYHQPQLRYLA